jgi:aspartate-semialdehyde dehydrogenase
MDESKKLIVPEINGNILTKEDKIIANPNCSTIQMVMALAPLHQEYTIKRLVISTYQSITGTGVKALQQLEKESKGEEADAAYPYQIHKNALPHCDVFLDNDYTKEEMKLVHETHKILNDSSMGITATAVRIPVVGGHSEAVNIEFEKEFEIKHIRDILKKTSGVEVQDDPKNQHYPMPLFAEGKDAVFVGRIRRDTSHSNALNMWIVADNLRKGAATNTVQIAEYLITQQLINVN